MSGPWPDQDVADTRPSSGVSARHTRLYFVPAPHTGMRITLDVDGERRRFEAVTTAERHGYGSVGVRLTYEDGRSEIVAGAHIIRADAD